MYPLSNVDCLVDGMACLSTCLTLYSGVYVFGGLEKSEKNEIGIM